MLKLFRKDLLTPQTERIYKVPLCIPGYDTDLSDIGKWYL